MPHPTAPLPEDWPDARTEAWRLLHPGSATPPRGWGRIRRPGRDYPRLSPVNGGPDAG